MPCTNGSTSSYNNFSYSTFSTLENFQQVKIDDLTKMLCGVMKKLETLEQQAKGAFYPAADIKDTVDGLSEWWTEHKKIDEERLEREKAAQHKEQLKQSALAKLTVEEAKALGLINE